MPTCTRNCWIAAALAGMMVALLTAHAAGWAGALFLGLIAAGLLGAVLVWAFCAGQQEEWTVSRVAGADVATKPAPARHRPEAINPPPLNTMPRPDRPATFTADASAAVPAQTRKAPTVKAYASPAKADMK